MSNKYKAEQCQIEAIEFYLDLAKQNGYKCWIMDENIIAEAWGVIQTPSGNIIGIVYNKVGGYSFCLKYIPSRNNGSGCQCLDNKYKFKYTIEDLQEAERQGLNFAKALQQPLYKSAEDALKSIYNFDEYKEY